MEASVDQFCNQLREAYDSSESENEVYSQVHWFCDGLRVPYRTVPLYAVIKIQAVVAELFGKWKWEEFMSIYGRVHLSDAFQRADRLYESFVPTLEFVDELYQVLNPFFRTDLRYRTYSDIRKWNRQFPRVIKFLIDNLQATALFAKYIFLFVAFYSAFDEEYITKVMQILRDSPASGMFLLSVVPMNPFTFLELVQPFVIPNNVLDPLIEQTLRDPTISIEELSSLFGFMEYSQDRISLFLALLPRMNEILDTDYGKRSFVFRLVNTGLPIDIARRALRQGIMSLHGIQIREFIMGFVRLTATDQQRTNRHEELLYLMAEMLENPEFSETQKSDLVLYVTRDAGSSVYLPTSGGRRLVSPAVSVLLLLEKKYHDLIAKYIDISPRAWLARQAGMTVDEFKNEQSLSVMLTARHHPKYREGPRLPVVIFNSIHTALATAPPVVTYTTW
jgi:hypothetical protein